MTIREARKQLESENYSSEDLMTLFEYYVKSSNESWRNHEDSENNRIYSIALKMMILERLTK